MKLSASKPTIARSMSTGGLFHIPGDSGWPMVGRTFELIADFKGFAERHVGLYGLVNRSQGFGGRNVNLLGPEANEFVLLVYRRMLWKNMEARRH